MDVLISERKRRESVILSRTKIVHERVQKIVVKNGQTGKSKLNSPSNVLCPFRFKNVRSSASVNDSQEKHARTWSSICISRSIRRRERIALVRVGGFGATDQDVTTMMGRDGTRGTSLLPRSWKNCSTGRPRLANEEDYTTDMSSWRRENWIDTERRDGDNAMARKKSEMNETITNRMNFNHERDSKWSKFENKHDEQKEGRCQKYERDVIAESRKTSIASCTARRKPNYESEHPADWTERKATKEELNSGWHLTVDEKRMERNVRKDEMSAVPVISDGQAFLGQNRTYCERKYPRNMPPDPSPTRGRNDFKYSKGRRWDEKHTMRLANEVNETEQSGSVVYQKR